MGVFVAGAAGLRARCCRAVRALLDQRVTALGLATASISAMLAGYDALVHPW